MESQPCLSSYIALVSVPCTLHMGKVGRRGLALQLCQESFLQR